MKQRRTSLKDLADKLGVSIATVSRALRNSHEVGEEMTQKVKQLAKELNYRPNPFAQSLRKEAPRVIGVIVQAKVAELKLHGKGEIAKSSYKDLEEAFNEINNKYDNEQSEIIRNKKAKIEIKANYYTIEPVSFGATVAEGFHNAIIMPALETGALVYDGVQFLNYKITGKEIEESALAAVEDYHEIRKEHWADKGSAGYSKTAEKTQKFFGELLEGSLLDMGAGKIAAKVGGEKLAKKMAEKQVGTTLKKEVAKNAKKQFGKDVTGELVEGAEKKAIRAHKVLDHLAADDQTCH